MGKGAGFLAGTLAATIIGAATILAVPKFRDPALDWIAKHSKIYQTAIDDKDKAEKENEELQAELEENQATLGIVRNELNATKTNLANVNAQLATANENLASERSAKQALQTRLDAELEAKAELQTALDTANVDKQALQTQLAEKNASIEALNAQIEAKDAEIARLTASLAEKDTTIENLIAQIAEKNTSIENLNTQINGLNARIEELNTEILDLNAEISNKQTQIAGLQLQLENLQVFKYGKYVCSIVDENGIYDDTYVEVLDNGKFRYYTDKENFVEMDYEATGNKVGDTISINFEEDGEVIPMSFEIDTNASFVSTADETIKYVLLTDELAEALESRQALQTRLASEEGDKSQLQAELESANARIVELENTVTTFQTQVETLNTQISTLQSQVESLSSDKAELEAQVTTLTARVTELEGQVETLTAEKQELQNQVDSLTADKATLQGQIDTLTNEKSTLASELETAQAQVASLTAELEEKENTITSLNAQIAEKDQAITNLQGQLDTANESIASLTAEVETLTSEKTTLTSRVSELEEQVTTLTNRISTLENQLAEFEQYTINIDQANANVEVILIHDTKLNTVAEYPNPENATILNLYSWQNASIKFAQNEDETVHAVLNNEIQDTNIVVINGEANKTVSINAQVIRPLAFTVYGNTVTGYTGNATNIEVPTSYSSVELKSQIQKGLTLTKKYGLTSGNWNQYLDSITFVSDTGIEKTYTNYNDCNSNWTNDFGNAGTVYIKSMKSKEIISGSSLVQLFNSTKTGILYPLQFKYKDVEYHFESFNSSSGPLYEFVNHTYIKGDTIDFTLYGLELVDIHGNDVSITKVADNFVKDNITIESVTIPEGITEIGANAFNGLTNISRIELPSTITNIGENAFANCSSLTEIVLNSSTVPTGTENMFDNTNDCQITVPFYAIDTYKSNWSVYADRISPDQEVLDFTFNGNQVTGYNGSATEIEIPASYSIKNVDGIDKFIVGNDYLVTSIGEAAFSNCDRITSITIPENITNIGISAFFNCLKLTTINFNAVTLDNLGQNSNIFYNAGKNGTGITVNIGNSVKSIPNYLFYIQELSGRPKIKTVNFGENLQSIGNNAFQFCSNINSLTIPNSVISIGDSAFQYCTGLTSVVLPSNIVQIGSSVFRDCRALTSIIIPNAVERISEYAFYGCENLNSILIPNSVDSIGGSAFFNCSGLTSITIKANVPPISSASTAILHGAAVCPIYVPAESVEAYKTSPYWSEYADRIQAILEEVVEEPEEVSIVGTWANKTSSELRITFLEDENYVIWNSADSSIEEQTGTYNFDGTTIYLYGTSNSMQGQFVNGELVFDDGVTVYERYVENTYFGIYAHTDDWNWAIKINDDGTWYAAQTAEMLQSGQYESSGTYEINDNKYIHLTGSYEETYEILNETTIVAVEHPENIFYKQSTLA